MTRVTSPAISTPQTGQPTAAQRCFHFTDEHQRTGHADQIVRTGKLFRVVERARNPYARSGFGPSLSDNGEQLIYPGRPLQIRLGHHHLIDDSFERFDEPPMIFVLHHGENENDSTQRIRKAKSSEVIGKHLCRRYRINPVIADLIASLAGLGIETEARQ